MGEPIYDLDFDPDVMFVDQLDSRAVIAAVGDGDTAERMRQLSLLSGTAIVGLVMWMMENDFTWVLDLYRAAGGTL